MRSDPVCKMEIDEKRAMNKAFYQGKDYYFCSAACQSQFQTNPESFGAGGARTENQPSPRGDTLSKQGGRTVRQAKSTVVDLKREAMERSKSIFEKSKHNAAGKLEATSKAFRQAAQNFQGENSVVSRYVDGVADKMDEASRYLREKEANQIIQDTEHFIKNQPVLVFSAAFAMGVVVARFLKSSGNAAATRRAFK